MQSTEGEAILGSDFLCNKKKRCQVIDAVPIPEVDQYIWSQTRVKNLYKVFVKHFFFRLIAWNKREASRLLQILPFPEWQLHAFQYNNTPELVGSVYWLKKKSCHFGNELNIFASIYNPFSKARNPNFLRLNPIEQISSAVQAAGTPEKRHFQAPHNIVGRQTCPTI